MSKVVLLKFGEGDWDVGFHVNLRIRETGKSEIEADGRLSPAPELPRLYQDWRMVYGDRQIGFRKGSLAEGKQSYRKLKKTAERITNFSVKDSAKALERCLNNWLNGENEGFRPIRETLLHHLNATDEIRFVISARSHLLWQLPWHLCDLFASYPHADVTLGSLERPLKSLVINPKDSIKILVVLGEAKDIDVEVDLQVLRDRLPDKAELLEPLVATDFKTLTEALWQNDIDILFFAGHSTSQGQQGRFFLNETDSVEIQELKYALQKAIARGLKLAIFNSCDGVQLARDLADVQMPAVIVMREPIPDEAAQAFLKYFLESFAENKMSLYRAVREARERLQGLEKKYPYLTWLPVLYQHPEAKDLRWDGMLQLTKAIKLLPTLRISRFHYLAASTAASVVLLGGLVSATPISNYINNKRSNSINRQGAVCLNQKKIECAREKFERALVFNPNNAKALNNMGLLYDSWHEYDRARKYFQKAKIQGNPAGCSNEARLDILEGKYDKAESLLQFCLLQVDHSIAQYFILKNLGWVLFESEKYSEAEKFLREAIAIYRNKGSANCVLAMTLEARDKLPEVLALTEWQYCLNARDEIDEEREWKRIAREKIQEFKEKKQ